MNTSKTPYDLPLLTLFHRLRQAGLPLGIDEYHLLLRALQGGFGIPDRDALARLCKTLWIKSAEEEYIFNNLFDQVMARSSVNETFHQPLQPFPNEPDPIHHKEPVFERIWRSILHILRRILQLLSAEKPTVTTPLVSTSEPSVTTPISPSPLSASETSLTFTSATPPELTMKIEDEVEVAKAVSLATSKNDDIEYNYFIQTDEYFPITRRQMKQSWRYLRRPIREGPLVELDVKATVNKVGRQGVLLEPVLVPRRINRVELLLLIDRGGSMVPFDTLSHRLAETALAGGRLGKANIYYFHNCPVEYLYNDPAYQEARPIQSILDGLHYNRTVVLVFSDAGAARGGLSLERIEMTKAFLNQLKQRVPYVVWLNPMPRSRWFDTTAGEVMKFVPMCDVSRRGLDDAIHVLRGRPISYLRSEVRV